ncbi:MAG: zinc ribbon domain-containing protein [Candidatus Cloacimonadota bacterium]|nr:MAG: zinc ribbon domain-containing protein [Candidatus Cloacimonadota bacterium]
MPTYEYKCGKCQKTFEIFHNISKTMRTCAECGGKLQKLMVPGGGVIFKGSGFYQTDYKRRSNGNGNGTKKKKTTVKEEEKKQTE